MLVYIQSFIICALCIYTSFTDIKSKKIYNKIIIYAFTLSSVVYICLFREIEKTFIINHIINVFITLVLSFAFFYFKIWAAGDAKLFTLISYMIPFSLYEVNDHNIFPSMYLLIFVFGIAFIYVVMETIVLWIKDNNKFSNFSQKGAAIKCNWKDFILQYLVAYFFVLLINNIILKFYFDFYIYYIFFYNYFYNYQIIISKENLSFLKPYLNYNNYRNLNLKYYLKPLSNVSCETFKNTTKL